MTSFDVRVPFKGEPTAVYKTVSDFFSYVDFETGKFTRVSDDLLSFSFPVTLGAFRLLLDGECNIIDRDLENHVSLVSINSKDRGGKGKLDARVRIYLEESFETSSVVCECEVTSKGMLARVALPIEDVLSLKISNALNAVIAEAQSSILIDDFADETAVELKNVENITAVEVDKSMLESIVQSGNLRSVNYSNPLWLQVLQFPAKLVTFPFELLKRLLISA